MLFWLRGCEKLKHLNEFFPTHCLTKLTVLHRSRSWLRLSQPCSRSSSRRWNPRDRGTKKGSVSGWCCLDLSNRYENKIEEIVDILIFERMSSSNTSFRIFLLRLIICPLNVKGIPTPRGSVSFIGSGSGSGSSSISCRLGSIGIHCDAWKWRGIDFQASQCIPIGPNMPLTLPPDVGIA